MYTRLILSLVTSLVLAGAASASDIILVIKNGRVERRDGKGTYKELVGNKGAVQAVTDGEFIVILYENGKIIKYDAEGTYKGLIGSGKAKSAQIGAGQIIVTYEKGKVIRYDAKTGAYKGAM